MKIHRFYLEGIDLQPTLRVTKPELIRQWLKVLRFRVGQQLVLFDGRTDDKKYEITEIQPSEVTLDLVAQLERKLPKKELYLFWSILKKDKNDWVIQKCTELGVSHFVPLLAARSEKTGINIDRAKKIAIEAAEQCGRSDIPQFQEPINVERAIAQYQDNVKLFVCEQSDDSPEPGDQGAPVGVFIGPEGGWTDREKQLFESKQLERLNLHDFTLRAETAVVTAVSKLQ